MPYFMLGIVLAAIISWYGWKKVCQIGNYESFYGFLMFWTMPLYLIGSLVTFWIRS